MTKKRTPVADGRKPKHSLDAARPSKGGKGRDAATVRRLKMYKTRAKRDAKGRVVHEDLQSKELPSTRIQPDRRWFGNTRVVGVRQLEQFREDMASKVHDSYAVLLRQKKLPLALLAEPKAKDGTKATLLAAAPFKDTFGKAATRKKPRLAAAVDGYGDLVAAAERAGEKYAERFTGGADAAALETAAADGFRAAARDAHYDKGQSKRIWAELYKVLDSSDVVVQVLDARDPAGTRCGFLESHLRANARHKHLILLLNKCDLVPARVTRGWLATLSAEYPTLAFHASVTQPFGKGALLGLLRQLARLRSDKKHVSVGFVGYPNVGKSSVINALRTKKVCGVAPLPGETRVWQYVALTRRVFLIDCPGVVHAGSADTDTGAVLKGVVRVESLTDAPDHVGDVLARVRPGAIARAYGVPRWSDAADFLDQLARRAGKLNRGGEPDVDTAAKMVLHDWQRGKLPYWEEPPKNAQGGDADAAPTHAVTADDAAGEAGASAPAAAAAAEALTRGVVEAARKQATSARLPAKEDDQGEGVSEEDERGSDDDEPASADSGDESDGYGEAGLSWEAVMASVRGGKGEEDGEESGGGDDDAPKRKPPRRRGKA